MEQRYCAYCGAQIDPDKKYCANCGMPLDDTETACHYGYRSHVEYRPYTVHVRHHLPASCILAYIPGFFWIPLGTNGKDRVHRQCANQGLWMMILALVFGAVILIGGNYLYQIGYLTSANLLTVFTGWTAHNWMLKLPTALGCQMAAAFMLTVPISMMCAIFKGTGSDVPYQIPGVGNIQLIKESCDEGTESK